MILRRVHPDPVDAAADSAPSADRVDIDEAGARALIAEWYAIRRPDWLRLNLVTSVGGSAAGTDGTSDTLSNRADRTILGVIRDLADLVLVGANSVRAEGYRLPRTADLAILTSTGDFGGRTIPERAGAGRLLVVCPPSAIAAVRSTEIGEGAELIVLGERAGRLDPQLVIGALRDRGYRSIVCEGGPTLAAQLLRAGLVDELALATSPRISPLALPVFGDAELPAAELQLAQVLLDDASGVYARWLFSRALDPVVPIVAAAATTAATPARW